MTRVNQELRNSSVGLFGGRHGSSRFLVGLLGAAGTATATATLPISGDRFFFDVGNGQLLIRPNTHHENPYFPGMGIKSSELTEPFTTLQLSNPNAHAVYYILWAGFDDLDDRRTFYPSIQFKQIVNSVFDWTDDAFAASIAVPDLSGTIITVDGVQYYVVNRQLLYAASTSNDYGLFICNAAGDRNLWPVPKNQGAQIPMSGDLTIEHSGGDSQPIISELYNCLPVPIS